MKRIVKGNDFTLRIPVMKMVEGEKQPFPLPSCTDIVVRVTNSFKRTDLEYSIDVAEDNVILARVEGDKMSLGTYAVEVRGKIFGADWRSNEYPQFQIVNNNADADYEFGATDEGDNSVEMDTALVILPPTVELSNLISDTNAALEEVKATEKTLTDNEALRVETEEGRVSAESERIKAEESRVQAEKKRESDASAAIEKVNADTSAAIEKVKTDTADAISEVQAKTDTAISDMQSKANSAISDVKLKSDTAISDLQTKSSDAISELQQRSDAVIKALDEHRTDFDEAEAARVEAEQARVEAETQREETLRANEQQRNDTLKQVKSECETATKAANDAASDATLAKANAEKATAGAEKVDALLDGNILTVTNRNGEQKSVNLTDSDEHVTVNFSTTVEDASVEGLIINVYINNGSDPLQYISDSKGQAEFTVVKGATYKVVFPYVQGCNILNPVQHVASVGNRIIDAAYVAETEKVERVTIKVSKAEDATSAATAWEGITVHVTVGGVKTDYTTDNDGKVIIEVKNGTSYTVAVDKIDGMYEQYNSYSRTRTAIAESYRQNFIFRNYESGIWLIDDENKQWTYDDWEKSGNDASKLMFVRIATLNTQRYQGDIIMSIEKMADFAKVAVSKTWCNSNVQFNNIPLNGRDTNNSNWSRFAYNGLLATQTIIAEGDERELQTPACDYCYGITISNGDKTYQGYLPTAYQWEVAWSNFDILVEGVNLKYPELQLTKSMFSGNKWTSTQINANSSYCFNTAVYGSYKNFSFLAIPFFACLSTSPSLLSLPSKEDRSEEAIKEAA